MRQGKGRTGIAPLTAFVAALVLVLQSALAIAAPPVQRDIFGNVICADGSGGHMPSGSHEGRLPDCCMLSCGGSFHLDAGLPAHQEFPGAQAAEEATVISSATIIARHDRRSPINPRAPPAAA